MERPLEWLTLFLRIKQQIVSLLDYESRCNLRLCSKTDRDLVDSTEFVAENVQIVEIPSDLSPDKTIIRLKIDTFTVWFIGKNDVTKVERAWNGELSELSEQKQESRYDVARRYLERFLRGRFEARSIKLHATSLLPSENWRLKCDRLSLWYLPNLAWLRQTVPQFKELEVRNENLNTLEVLPHILNTSESLRVYRDTDVTDGHLALIAATDLRIGSNEITPEGVRNTLERFLRNGKETDVFEIELPLPNGFEPMHLIPKSAIVRKDSEPSGFSPAAYNGEIVGGFENVHGVQEARQFSCFPYGQRLIVMCRVHRKQSYPLMLYPFTNH